MDALVGHIGDEHAQMLIVQSKHIIKVAADFGAQAATYSAAKEHP